MDSRYPPVPPRNTHLRIQRPIGETTYEGCTAARNDDDELTIRAGGVLVDIIHAGHWIACITYDAAGRDIERVTARTPPWIPSAPRAFDTVAEELEARR